jgi:hypothetical protein
VKRKGFFLCKPHKRASALRKPSERRHGFIAERMKHTFLNQP